MKRFILVAYDPDDVMPGRKGVNLFDIISELMDRFRVRAHVIDFGEKDPRK